MFTLALGFGVLALLLDFLIFSAILFSVENDTFPLVAAVGIAALAIFQFMFGYPVFAWILANIGFIITVAGLYFLGGALYSIVRWYFFVNSKSMKEKITRSFEEYKRLSFNENNSENIVRANFLQSASNPLLRGAANYKWKISNWIALWPADLLWRLIRNVTVDAIEFIYDSLGGIYKKISTNSVDKVIGK